MRHLVFSLILFISCSALAQEDTLALSIEQCRAMALEHNKSIQSAALSTEAAYYTKRSTWGLFFPNISINGAAGYSNSSGGFGLDLRGTATALLSGAMASLTPSQQAVLSRIASSLPDKFNVVDYEMGWMYTAGVMLRQPLFMGGKIFAGYRMSKYALEAARHNERKTKAEVIEEADQAYANVVKAVELRRVAQQYVLLLEALDRNVESAVRNGMKLQNDRLKVQVKLDEVRLQLTQADNAIRFATMNLCHVTGLPLRSRVSVTGDYPRVDDALMLQGADVMNRPEYALLEAKVQVAHQEVKSARAGYLPQLALLANYGYTNGVNINGRKLIDSWGFMGGVTLSIPIYHFGVEVNKVKAAKARALQAEVDRDNLVEMMQLQLAQEGNRLEESSLEVSLTEKALEQATLNRQLSERQYEVGRETLTDLLEAQALWQQAWQRSIEAQFQRYLSSVAYLRAAGRLVSE